MYQLGVFIFFCMSMVSHLAFAEPIKTIRFATEATYPPFEYVDATGQIQGFDIALAKALCAEMQARCYFENQAFNSLIPSLQIGRYDAIISALGITAERQKQVAFTDAYYEPSSSFVSAIRHHYHLSDLIGKKIGVQISTTFATYLEKTYADTIEIKYYSSIQDAFLDLLSGRVDAVLADTPIALSWLKQNDNHLAFAIVEHPLINHQYFGAGYGIAVAQNNPVLLKALNEALKKIKANGVYQKLMDTYFSDRDKS
jgi:arginine transport system substrate-binding protein